MRKIKTLGGSLNLCGTQGGQDRAFNSLIMFGSNGELKGLQDSYFKTTFIIRLFASRLAMNT